MQYNAVAFLDSLFQSPETIRDEIADRPDPALPPSLGMTPADLPPEWHLAWDEGAAIMEFDGKLPRERAEALALADVLRAMERAGISVTSHA
jgi:hypothetical protein